MAHVLMRALLLSLLTTSAAVSASPFKFSYGGQLSNEKGPVTGPVKIELKFYRVSAGGDAVPVTPVIFENVPLQDGVFQVEITQLTAEELTTVFDGSNSVYIEVTDRTNNLTYPRQQVNSVPFALKVPID